MRVESRINHLNDEQLLEAYFLSQDTAHLKACATCLDRFDDLARTMEQVPRTCGSALNSALRLGDFELPVPVPCGHPVWAMNPPIMRWKTMPS